MLNYYIKIRRLVGEGEATHTGLDTEDVVVHGEHVHGSGAVGSLLGDMNLGIVDTGEVTGAGGLVLLGLQRERVRVDTGHGATGVVVEGLHLVEVLTLLTLEAILTVEDELELIEGTDELLSEATGTTEATRTDEGSADVAGGYKCIGNTGRQEVGLELDVSGSARGGEVPERVPGGGVGEAPDELLDGVVVREADLGRLTGGDAVDTGVLNLLDEVLVTLLGEAAALLGVEVDVVGPDLELFLVEVGGEVGGEIDVDADLVVLEGDEGEVKTGVAVEEEDERKVDGVAFSGGGHLTPVDLLGLVEVQLGVHAPPLLVMLIDALTTDGKLDVVDGTLGHPVAVIEGARGGGVGGQRFEFDVHVTNEITVASDGDGYATRVGGGAVDGLFDVLHRKVGVTLIFRLEEGHLRVTGEVNILGTVSYELHETTGHFESIVLYTEKKILGKCAFMELKKYQ